MKGTVLSEPEVRDLLKKFVFAELYTDPSAANEPNIRLQKERFKDPALPIYVTIGPDDVERSRIRGMVSKEKFIEFLKKGLDPETSSK